MTNNTNWEGKKIGDVKKKLAEEITQCSKCKYWKGKSGCYLWGDKPCSQHGRKLTQLEDEVEKIIGKEVRGIIENSQITIVQRPTLNQLFEATLKVPYSKKNETK